MITIIKLLLITIITVNSLKFDFIESKNTYLLQDKSNNFNAFLILPKNTNNKIINKNNNVYIHINDTQTIEITLYNKTSKIRHLINNILVDISIITLMIVPILPILISI